MFINDSSLRTIPLIPCHKAELTGYLKQQTKRLRRWITASGFQAKKDEFCLLPNKKGELQAVLFTVNEPIEYRWALAGLAEKLPLGNYQLPTNWTEEQKQHASIGWGLGCYQFKRYHPQKDETPCLLVNDGVKRIKAFVESITLVRDLVNTPAADMMPQDLAAITKALSKQYQGTFKQIKGKQLLSKNYPCLHAVGRASKHKPRLIHLKWGNKSYPKVTLVGKGVCFDTGGLDLKPSQFMRLMKKDMGGAAHVLGLAQLIMSLSLPVCLEVFISAADNAISNDAFRPGDVLTTRSGKTVEIDNTDAEGRLVLCDALTKAGENNPDLLIDFATLTGAARVAVGTEIPAFFSNSESLTQAINQAATESNELVWQLPLHQPYRHLLDSDIADLLNSAPQGYGGAITAALYLNEFVDEQTQWAHFDMMAWNNRHRSGRPKGGEAMGLFAVFQLLENRYAE
ncbi:MAG: leucyl aminopeptidase family protein [Cocleimonas sp.]|nr:leucyl aminopeptidase family protein [Cocleimonas sp.]